MIFGMKKLITTLGAFAIVLLAPIAQALPVNLVSDPSFEDFGSGWTFTGQAATSDLKFYDGHQSMTVVATPPDHGKGTAEQTVALNSALSYLLDFYVFGGSTSDFSGFSVSFGSQTLATFGKESGALNPEWTHFSTTFTGNSGGSLIFKFDRAGDNFLDLVSVTSPVNVPEPGSLFLVGAALAAGAMFRRKKQVQL